MKHSVPTRRSSDLPSQTWRTATIPSASQSMYVARPWIDHNRAGITTCLPRMGLKRSDQPGYTAGHEKSQAQKRSEEHTSELQSLMRISYAVFCLNKNK